jgi:hypothetical protein
VAEFAGDVQDPLTQVGCEGLYRSDPQGENMNAREVPGTARKVLDQLAHEHSKRQGGGTLAGESRISPGRQHWDQAAIEQVVGDEPTPEFAAQVAEEYQRLLDLPGGRALQRVAVRTTGGLIIHRA